MQNEAHEQAFELIAQQDNDLGLSAQELHKIQQRYQI
jgi:hypothetical protein